LRTTICNAKANTTKTRASHTDSGVISRTLVADSHLTSSILVLLVATLPHRRSSPVFDAILSALKMETVCLFKTLVSTDVFTRRHNPEVHRHENLKTRILSRHQLRHLPHTALQQVWPGQQRARLPKEFLAFYGTKRFITMSPSDQQP
jgi:hypothetical protein